EKNNGAGYLGENPPSIPHPHSPQSLTPILQILPSRYAARYVEFQSVLPLPLFTGVLPVPRKPQVRFFPSRGAFYCQVNGMQRRLGPGTDDGPEGPRFKAAVKAYTALICHETADTAKDTNKIKTIRDLYLKAIRGKRPETIKVRVKMLARFCDFENGAYGE